MVEGQDLVRFEHGGYRWVAARGFADVILHDPRACAPEGAEDVKIRPARRVWRFAPRDFGSVVYAKKYLLPDLRDRAKYAVQRSKAEHEFETMARLRERGVSVPEPLAAGVRRSGGILRDSILITRALEAAMPLDEYFPARMGRASHKEATAFTTEFARFVRQLHDAGLFHRDFHAGNVFVGGTGEKPAFWLLDLADTRLGASLSLADRLANLAILGRFFCQFVPRHWRLRFLKAYLDGTSDVASAARRIEKEARRGMHRVWLKRDRRACGTNLYYGHVAAGPFTGHARTEPLARAALELFRDGDPFARARAILKDTRSSTVGVFEIASPDGPRLVLVKRRNPRRDWRMALDPCRSSRGMRGFFFGAAFENRRIPTPHVLAALEDRRFGFLFASYLVQEYVPEAETLGDVMAESEESPIYRIIARDRGGFIARLARLVRGMHERGLSMRDLKAANILLRALGDGRIEPLVADLDGARLYSRAVSEARAMQNVARLYFDAAWLGAATRREAMLFLETYLGPPRRERTIRWLRFISRYVKAKRRTFKPKGVFAERAACADIASD